MARPRGLFICLPHSQLEPWLVSACGPGQHLLSQMPPGEAASKPVKASQNLPLDAQIYNSVRGARTGAPGHASLIYARTAPRRRRAGLVFRLLLRLTLTST